MKEEAKEIIKQLRILHLTQCYLDNLIDLDKQYEQRLVELEDHLTQYSDKIEKLENAFVIFNSAKNRNQFFRENYLGLSLEYNRLSKTIQNIKKEIYDLQKSLVESDGKAELLKRRLADLEIEYTKPSAVLYADILKRHKELIIIKFELEEAISVGVKLNKRYNDALKFLELPEQRAFFFGADNPFLAPQMTLDKLHSLMSRLDRLSLEYDTEMQDVAVFKGYELVRTYPFRAEMITAYNNVLAQFEKHRGYAILKEFFMRYKKRTMDTTKALRTHLRSLKKEIVLVEEEEAEMMKKL